MDLLDIKDIKALQTLFDGFLLTRRNIQYYTGYDENSKEASDILETIRKINKLKVSDFPDSE